MRVLLADDSSTIRRILRGQLETLGYVDIEEASDGKSALSKLAEFRFDFVLLDWNMPNLSGLEVLKRMKADPALQATHVIMVTTEAEKPQIVGAFQAGASGYLLKPFKVETLRDKLESLKSI